MDHPVVALAVQYLKRNVVNVLVPSYVNKSPVQSAISARAQIDKLPEADHWRVELDLSVRGVNAEGVECVQYGCVLEGIAVVRGLSEADSREALAVQVGGSLLAQIRAQLSFLSTFTGYGTLTLPPVTPEVLLQMASASAGQTAEPDAQAQAESPHA